MVYIFLDRLSICLFAGIKFWETTRDDGDAYCDEASVDEHRDAKQHVGWRGQKKN